MPDNRHGPMNTGISDKLKSAFNLMQQGNLPAAEAELAVLKKNHNKNGAVWALASEIFLRQGKTDKAWTEVERAVQLEATNAKRYVQHARCAVLIGLIKEAKSSVNTAIHLGVSNSDDLLMLASVLVRSDDHRGALTLYQQVETIQPDHSELHRGMATVYRFLGELENAEVSCDRAIEINPHDYEMLNLRSSLRKQSEADNHLDELQTLLKNGVRNWRGAVQVAYAVAKEYEDLEKFDDAFNFLNQGASLRRKNTKYNVKDDVRIFAAIRETFSQQALERVTGTGYESRQAIFILGLPRTGSTLIERIISSHSAVTTAGELNDFAVELMSLVSLDNQGRQPGRLELPEATLSIDMHSLGKNYIQAVKPLINEKSRFIDKLPLNSLYLGLIYLALPSAKVIHVKRNPLDACFAMYKYLFKNAYPFSYDLDELGDYFIEHHKLMEHWRAVLPENWMYEVYYEDIVCNQKEETGGLLDFLGLAWEEECLNFHENKQASTTGSASQVREPLYRSSVGKWKHYKKQLQPLLEKLQASGITIDSPD